MPEQDIMVRGDSGQFETVDREELADELIAERFGYTTEEIEEMIEEHENALFGRIFI